MREQGYMRSLAHQSRHEKTSIVPTASACKRRMRKEDLAGFLSMQRKEHIDLDGIWSVPHSQYLILLSHFNQTVLIFIGFCVQHKLIIDLYCILCSIQPLKIYRKLNTTIYRMHM